MTCNQVGCYNIASHRVYWPGSKPVDVCKVHVQTANMIADGMQIKINVEELNDSTREDKGNSQDSKGEVY